MNKIKIFLGSIIGLILFQCTHISAFELIHFEHSYGLTGNCPTEYCSTYKSELDCKCYYNSIDNCYCEIPHGGGVNCHLNCVVVNSGVDDFIEETINNCITITVVIAIFLLIRYIIRTIKIRKLFGKVGEKKRYALIPIRNTHIRNKINNNKKRK